MNCVLIGLGMVAPTHLAALNASQTVSLAGVLGRDLAKTRIFAKHHGNPHVYDDLDAVLDQKTVDFAILATPPDARVQIIERLTKAGLPILMEKPIERTFTAAKQIVEQCDAAQVPLGLVFQHRARQASLALKDAIAGGALGQIVACDIRVPWWRDQAYYDEPGRGSFARDGGGVLITQAIHTLDLALWLLGPVSRVQALLQTTPLHQMESEDWAGALLQFKSGAMGNLTATTAAYPGSAESISIQGTKAAAHLAEGILTLHHLDGRTEQIGATAHTGGGADPMGFSHDWHQAVIEDFADALKTGREPLAPGHEALRAHALIDAMERASQSGQIEKVARP